MQPRVRKISTPTIIENPKYLRLVSGTWQESDAGMEGGSVILSHQSKEKLDNNLLCVSVASNYLNTLSKFAEGIV